MATILENEHVRAMFFGFIEGGENNCWNWVGGKSKGYGYFYWKNKNWAAHRLMYEYMVGDILAYRMLHHSCENRACINPRHLRQVTRAEHGKLHRKLPGEIYLIEKNFKAEISVRKLNPQILEERRIINKLRTVKAKCNWEKYTRTLNERINRNG